MIQVAVIVPALNEERTVAMTVGSIVSTMGDRVQTEVIVVDHGSTDKTVTRAQGAGASIVHAPQAPTIGALRNLGVAASSGDLLVFLDADVTVSPRWAERVVELAASIEANDRIITGNICRIPDDAGWIERSWFGNRRGRPTHLGSGHLLIPRSFFMAIGGFDEILATGEDYDICQRAVRNGGEVRIDPQLDAVHHGFPRTLGQFFRREIWHGVSDARSLRHWSHSKIAIAATAFATLHVGAGFAFLSGHGSGAIAALTAAASIAVSLAAWKFGPRVRQAPGKILLLSYAYLTARALSVVHAGRRVRS